MANGDENETVSICQWRYHGSNENIIMGIQKLDRILTLKDLNYILK